MGQFWQISIHLDVQCLLPRLEHGFDNLHKEPAYEKTSQKRLRAWDRRDITSFFTATAGFIESSDFIESLEVEYIYCEIFSYTSSSAILIPIDYCFRPLYSSKQTNGRTISTPNVMRLQAIIIFYVTGFRLPTDMLSLDYSCFHTIMYEATESVDQISFFDFVSLYIYKHQHISEHFKHLCT